MTELDDILRLKDELRLKEALIEKYENKCHFCGKSNVPLIIEHILGQKELERQYFDKFERSSDFVTDYDELFHCYYNQNFDEESKYIGLVCKNCKVIQKEIPGIEDVLSLVNDFFHRGDRNEFELMISKHPQTIPIIDRRLRLLQQITVEEIQARQDNLGRKNV